VFIRVHSWLLLFFSGTPRLILASESFECGSWRSRFSA
jgi:hypothetical protein